MLTSPHHLSPPRGRRAAALALAALLAALLLPFVGSGPATAASTPQSNAAATWLAGLVGPDGAVEDPNSGNPSVSGTVQVALALVANQSDRDAIDRALGYILPNVGTYVVSNGQDSPGRLGYLLVLASATGGDARDFGTPGVDLVARLDATYGAVEPGFFGTPDQYNAVFNQSLSVIGLVAAGQPVPAGAITWLTEQQCDAGNSSEGGWQGYRSSTAGVLDPCEESSGTMYTGADSNSTAIAVQALAAAGANGPVAAAVAFLGLTQSATSGGFGYYAGDTVVDPNSTALGIQALVAAGEDPTGGAWSVGGGTPYSSLAGWQITSGADAGALASPYSSGAADFLATFQGLWGLAMAPLPFPVLPAPMPTTTTTAPTPTPTTTVVPGAAPAAAAVSSTPAFTG